LLFAGAGSASADTVPAIPSVTAPDASANPTINTDICGNGVGVFGSGTDSSCSSSAPSSPAASDGSGIDVSPSTATAVCGTGVGLFGTGTTSDCDGSPSAAAVSDDDPVTASPTAENDVCGNGAGVFGTGSTSSCDPATTAGVNSSDPTADNTGSFNLTSSVLAAHEVANPAVPVATSGGPLAFTGAGVALTTVIGSALAALGAFLLRARQLI
jgi:hypothetical protein